MFKVFCAALGAAVLLSPGLLPAAPTTGPAQGPPRACSAAARPTCPGEAAPKCTAGAWSCPAPGLTEAACRGDVGPACPSPTIMECHNGHWICVGPARPN